MSLTLHGLHMAWLRWKDKHPESLDDDQRPSDDYIRRVEDRISRVSDELKSRWRERSDDKLDT